MKFNYNGSEGGITKGFMSIVLEEQNKFIKKTMVIKTEKIINVIKDNIIGVINDYNIGTIERYEGDFNKRVLDNNKFDRNLPLIDTRDYINSIEGKISKSTMSNLKAEIYTNIEYSKYLENGTNTMEGYRVFEIALYRSKQEIDRILAER